MASQQSAWEGMVSGGVAGGITRLIAAPLDLLKIRFQVQTGGRLSGQYKSLFHAVIAIYREEGLRTFWRGNVAATALWISYSGVQFGCYQAIHNITPADSKYNWLWHSANGAFSGVAATIATYPFDLCRTVMSSQGVPKVYPNTRAFFHQTLKNEGVVGGLYKGLGPAVYQIIPYMGLSFGIYSTLNDLTSKASHSQLEWFLKTVGNGAIAGFVSKLLVYPLDTIKKRMQMQGVPRHSCYGHIIPVYGSSWQCGRDILRKEGLYGLYRGTVPSLLKSMLTHSCTFTVYELTAKSIQQVKLVTQIA